MNENINLCEILKGHEDEIFWSPLYGNVKLLSASYDKKFPIRIEEINEARRAILLSNGHYSEYDEGECMLFPSKDQRDWNKWIEEQKSKITPKTWRDILNNRKVYLFDNNSDYCVDITGRNCLGFTRRNSSIEKSALALLKIHQLIEMGYGGLITNPNTYQSIILWDYREGKPYAETFQHVFKCGNLIRIKPEYAEEFLSYPENIQLLKDYFIID